MNEHDAATATLQGPNYAVWLMIGVPLTAVIVGITMAVISFRTFDGVVEDDYYKQGKEINRSLERDRYAQEAGLQAALSFKEGEINVAISAEQAVELPLELGLEIIHPTRSGLDIHVALFADQPDKSKFRGNLEALPVGSRIIQLETPTWRLNKRMNIPEAQTDWSLILEPVQ